MENSSSASVQKTNKVSLILLNEIDSEEANVTKTVFFIALGLVIIFGNATSIVIFWRRRFFLQRSAILLMNLTAADLLVGFVIIFTIMEDILPSYFISREIYSEMNVGFDAFALLSSILFLAAISVERAHAVLRPVRHLFIPTRYYFSGVLTVWFMAGFLSAINLLPLHAILSKQITITVISTSIGLALLIIFISYASIWFKFNKRMFNPSTARTEMNQKLYFNSLLNPIVYNLRMPDFRKEMIDLICGCCIKDIPKRADIRLKYCRFYVFLNILSR
ncbi:unnamed protein product [Porites lobata]|uniref:G-protein coupled receptors family 1 profile domain-containing protein n=1 Tax=Porites lobata TaxID=104759 RepID=A0ABN8QSY5_9CNID|nr:unnamed protein product [Porites lobata]